MVPLLQPLPDMDGIGCPILLPIPPAGFLSCLAALIWRKPCGLAADGVLLLRLGRAEADSASDSGGLVNCSPACAVYSKTACYK